MGVRLPPLASHPAETLHPKEGERFREKFLSVLPKGVKIWGVNWCKAKIALASHQKIKGLEHESDT